MLYKENVIQSAFERLGRIRPLTWHSKCNHICQPTSRFLQCLLIRYTVITDWVLFICFKCRFENVFSSHNTNTVLSKILNSVICVHACNDSNVIHIKETSTELINCIVHLHEMNCITPPCFFLRMATQFTYLCYGRKHKGRAKNSFVINIQYILTIWDISICLMSHSHWEPNPRGTVLPYWSLHNDTPMTWDRYFLVTSLVITPKVMQAHVLKGKCTNQENVLLQWNLCDIVIQIASLIHIDSYNVLQFL